MVRESALAVLALSPILSFAQQTFSVNPSEPTGAIQTVFNGAAPGDTVEFSAGTYSITTPLFLPCGVTIMGPLSVPAKAVLAATYIHNDIFFITDCLTPTTIKYLGFANTGAIYVTAPSAGLTIQKNQFTNLQANDDQRSDAAVYFDGKNGGLIANTTVRNNTFGDPSSCSAVMSVNADTGGYCAGIQFQGNIQGMTVLENEFTHLEEGFHVLCFGNLCGGSGAPAWSNFTAQWNDFNNIHRIAMEMQPQAANNVFIQYNSYENAFAPSWFSMGISAACCAGLSGVTVPIVNDNALLANTPPAGSYIAYALEWWGNGAQANNNLIQGFWANGIAYGEGGPPWEVLNNTIEGPYLAELGCYVCNEHEGATTVPTQEGNTESGVIAPVVSVAPQISENDGNVVITDAEPNTSIYFTINGSTPTTHSTLYTQPFAAIPGSTVKAIGMWGKGANPKSYPAGYGFVPSHVVSQLMAQTSTGESRP